MEKLKSSDFTVINLSVTSDVKPETMIDSHHFSSFDKLLRITSWVKRFVYNCRSSKLKKSGNLTAEEITDALEVWIKEIQQRFSSMQLTLPLPSLLLPTPFTKGGGRGRAISKIVAPMNMKFCRVLETPLKVSEMLKLFT